MMARDVDIEREIERIEGGGPRRARRAAAAVALVVAAVAVAFAAWWFLGTPDYSSYADRTIRVVGVEAEPIDVSVAELGELGCGRVGASGKNAAGAQASVGGWGLSIDDFLAAHGRARGEFVKVRFKCLDGYKVVLRQADLEEYEDIYLAIADAHFPLRKSSQPARLLIPGADSNRWCYAIESIEFLETDPGVERDSTDKAQGE